jgi:hypothetical protein
MPEEQRQSPSSAAAAATISATNSFKDIVLDDETDPQGKSRLNSKCNVNMISMASLVHRLRSWQGAATFAQAQVQVAVVLAIAYIGNNWKDSYPRNDNHNIPLFWFMNVALLVAGALTLQHKPGREGSVQLLSRSQTEEWKGWMQWAFIMVRVEL